MKSVNELPNGSEKSSRETANYFYRSAGITVRPGYIPLWLLLVVIGLFVWGGYYLFAYWSPP
jgi:hypothetical protein